MSTILFALTSFMIQLDSCFAITAAVTPAVAIDDTPMAVPTKMGTETTKRLSLAMAVPLCCCKYSDVKLSNMDVSRWNFFVAISRGDHSRPLWQRLMISSDDGWSGASQTLSNEYKE